METCLISNEEGYDLVKKNATYYWYSGKFYSLASTMELEDVIHDIYIKLLKHNHFAKYDPSVTSKNYYISRAVFTTMVDMLRSQKINVSLDKENDEFGHTLGDMIDDSRTNVEVEAVGSADRDILLSKLPSTSPSPVKGYCKNINREVGLDYLSLALMLEAGMTPKTMASVLINPKTNEPVSVASVTKYIGKMRDFIRYELV